MRNRTRHFIENIFGRKRFWQKRPPQYNPDKYNSDLNQCGNFPIQSTNADLMYTNLRAFLAHEKIIQALRLIIHDCFVFEVPHEGYEAIVDKIKTIMVTEVKRVFLEINPNSSQQALPLEALVDTSISDTLG